MTITGAFPWAVALAIATLAVWTIFIVFIPTCLCSMFRYRLWRLRDAVKDDMLYGRLPDRAFIGEFLSMVEAFILVADKFTLIQVILLPSNEEETARRRNALIQSLKELGEEHLQLFKAYRKEFVEIIVMRLVVGSLTGWVFLTLLLPALLLMLACRLVQRASISATDLVISVINHIEKMLNKLLNRQSHSYWPDVTGKIMIMGVISSQSTTLNDCAA